MKRRWPIFALVAAIAVLWIAYDVTHPFHPNYKNYDKTLDAPSHANGS
jgi:hypothetical protein